MKAAKPFAAAHRGLSAEHPENTLAAFEAAVEAGFPCLEMDLRRTRDGEVVVLHDAGVERTTQGNGRVDSMTYDELRSLDTGAGPVPRLDDVFAALSDWEGLWNLEMKDNDATGPALELAQHHGVLDRVLVSSMSPKALKLALERFPDAPRGLIVLGPVDGDDLEMAAKLGCQWINADHDFMSDAVAERIHGEGFHLGVWTVNDPDRALEMTRHGVSCVITDTREVLHAMNRDLLVGGT
ncbi:MAG: glycerophosphodiester phosphodiesterase [Thermoplasmatota archaeon]